jgi:hypothetical protein
MPLAIPSAVRFFLRGVRRKRSNSRVRPLIEFSDSSAYCPAETSRSATADGSSYGLLIPSAHAACTDPRSRARHAHSVPPAGFVYPLGGLLSAHTGRAYFIPAALMGFTLRSVLLTSGIRRVSAEMNPHTVFPVVLSGRAARRSWRRGDPGRPDGPRFLGFDPLESTLSPASD